MKNRFRTMLLIALTPAALVAQDDKNLVKNPGFEATQGKLKRAKAIAVAKDWKSPTGEPADLYSSACKDPGCATENAYGKEDNTAGGNNYAGLVIYSFGDKQPRTYITTELLGPLKQGVEYCISFDISLADNCKYAVNNIGAYPHKKEMAMVEKNNLIITDPMVKHPKNKVITQSYGWEKVCNVYKATGGEKYLTIGNFNATKETKNEKIAKPKGSTAQQLPIAYYYIDNVAVFQLDSIQECQCDVPKEEKAHVNYSEEFGSNKEFSPEEKIAQNSIHFDNMSSALRNDEVEHLNKIIEVMNANPTLKVEIISHDDPTEFAKIEVDDRAKDLCSNRAKTILDYFVKGGLSADRFVKTLKEDQQPITTEKNELGMAKNRRVEFKAIK